MSTRKTVIIKDSKRLKIGFSFGAASYYREMSSFCPLGHICWCLNPDGTLLSEKYVVFWHQTSSPDGAITYYDEYESADPYEEVFLIQLDLLPAGIKELVFVVKMFAPKFSNHIVKLEAETINAQYNLPNLSKEKEKNMSRVLVRIHRETEWVLDVCEDFIDIDTLI